MRALLMFGLSGCVQVYQPLSGLHQPVVIDTRAPNFEDVKLTILCPPGEALTYPEASTLCQRVEVLFENQGAQVRTSLSPRGFADDSLVNQDAFEATDDAAPRMSLVMELETRETYRDNDLLNWAMCVGSFTLVPGITELNFAQDIVIRDDSGFLLLRDSLEGRLIRRFGAGAWVGNRVVNLVRKPEDKIKPETASEDLSGDMYRQLSQLLFNAKMRRRTLNEVVP
ncbi:MAG: hypothetical protein AAFV53_29360 [Myxococcota bacterium]